MDSVKDTTTRLRRTFRYPAEDDDSDDSLPEAMDEQEQERFIARLVADNASRNAQFRRVLLAIPVLAALPYVPALLRPSTALLALLGITSLLSTSFLLFRLPPSATGFDQLDALARGGTRGGGVRPGGFGAIARSPLELYLPYLNLGLAGLLVLMGLVGGGGEKTSGLGGLGLGYLPAIVFAVVLVAKMVMASVDPEAELTALKYEYKGA